MADNYIDVHRNRNNKEIYENSIKEQTVWWNKQYPYLKKYGYNPAIAPIDCFYRYISIGYSTHRMAYLSQTDQKYVPIRYAGSIEGPKFIPEEYLYNHSEYEQLIKVREEYYPRTVDYKVLGFCKEQYAQLVEHNCKSIGIYEKRYTGKVKWNKDKLPSTRLINAYAIRMIKHLENENLEVFVVHLNKQKMICRNRRIESVYVNEINSTIKKAGYICGTLIESDILDVLLGHCTEQLNKRAMD